MTSTDDRVVIELHRPDHRNAINESMVPNCTGSARIWSRARAGFLLLATI
ncbi:MAG TPA: hypothetical protein VFR27_19200 [Mycobacterium sp.]|nr:hypothetical protein [Mycobacterium sp.]